MKPITLQRYNTVEGGVKTALVQISGPRWMRVLTMDGKLSVTRVPRTEECYMTDIPNKKGNYPIEKAIPIFRRYGRSFGITRNAKIFLRQAQQQRGNTHDQQRKVQAAD